MLLKLMSSASFSIFNVGVLVCSGCRDRIPLTGWFQQQTFLPVLEAEKSKIKVLADSVPGERPLLVWNWPPSCCILTWWGEDHPFHVSYYEGTNHYKVSTFIT